MYFIVRLFYSFYMYLCDRNCPLLTSIIQQIQISFLNPFYHDILLDLWPLKLDSTKSFSMRDYVTTCAYFEKVSFLVLFFVFQRDRWYAILYVPVVTSLLQSNSTHWTPSRSTKETPIERARVCHLRERGHVMSFETVIVIEDQANKLDLTCFTGLRTSYGRFLRKGNTS